MRIRRAGRAPRCAREGQPMAKELKAKDKRPRPCALWRAASCKRPPGTTLSCMARNEAGYFETGTDADSCPLSAARPATGALSPTPCATGPTPQENSKKLRAHRPGRLTAWSLCGGSIMGTTPRQRAVADREKTRWLTAYAARLESHEQIF